MWKHEIVWTDVTLKLTPTQELQIATSDRFTPAARSDAFKRWTAKRWYETIVLAKRLTLDLQQIDPQEAAEVAHLRSLVGVVSPPWFAQKELVA